MVRWLAGPDVAAALNKTGRLSKRVEPAGDAVATRDYWRDRRGYYNCVDFDLSAQSMDRLRSLADIIVPGHDNYFLNLDTHPKVKNSR